MWASSPSPTGRSSSSRLRRSEGDGNTARRSAGRRGAHPANHNAVGADLPCWPTLMTGSHSGRTAVHSAAWKRAVHRSGRIHESGGPSGSAPLPWQPSEVGMEMIVGDCTMSHAGDRDSRTAASQPPDRIGGSCVSTCARLPHIPGLPSSRPGTPPAPGIAVARFPFTGPGATGILPSL